MESKSKIAKNYQNFLQQVIIFYFLSFQQNYFQICIQQNFKYWPGSYLSVKSCRSIKNKFCFLIISQSYYVWAISFPPSRYITKDMNETSNFIAYETFPRHTDHAEMKRERCFTLPWSCRTRAWCAWVRHKTSSGRGHMSGQRSEGHGPVLRGERN